MYRVPWEGEYTRWVGELSGTVVPQPPPYPPPILPATPVPARVLTTPPHSILTRWFPLSLMNSRSPPLL